MLSTSDLNSLFECAKAVVNANTWRSLDYVSDEQLALWLVRVYEGYTQRKVLTERIYGNQDITIILSNHKLSVILNETSQHSYAVAESIFEYHNTEEDFTELLQLLDIAILRAELV